METNKFKLLLKKAIFTGNTFLQHTDNIDNIIYTEPDEALIDLFENDEEAFELLNKWEAIREKLSTMASED